MIVIAVATAGGTGRGGVGSCSGDGWGGDEVALFVADNHAFDEGVDVAEMGSGALEVDVELALESSAGYIAGRNWGGG